jgi:dolichyl-phosphate beta-glucosyltransferase
MAERATGVGERTSFSAERIALSIVLPAYQEADRLPGSLERIAAHLGERRAETELIVVDDGSADATSDVARSAGADLGLSLRVLRHVPNRGKGFAVRRGALAARGAAVLVSDVDLSVSIDHLDRFLQRLDAGAELVTGSRRIAGAHIALHQAPLREWLGAAFRGLATLLLVPRVSDFTCGFKLFSHRAAREIFALQRVWGWGCDVEILFLARRLGIPSAEVPVTWCDDPRSRVQLIRDIPRSLIDLARIRWHDLCGRYTAAQAGDVDAGGARSRCES